MSSFFVKTCIACIFAGIFYLCKMKNKLLIFPVFVFAVFLLTSCGQSIEKQLTGTWKAADVNAEFDETKVTAEMLRQVVEREKQTFFRILNDSTMVIISGSNTFEANWTYDEESGDINYFFEGNNTVANKLGTYEEGRIISNTKTALGPMTIYYEKDK